MDTALYDQIKWVKPFQSSAGDSKILLPSIWKKRLFNGIKSSAEVSNLQENIFCWVILSKAGLEFRVRSIFSVIGELFMSCLFHYLENEWKIVDGTKVSVNKSNFCICSGEMAITVLQFLGTWPLRWDKSTSQRWRKAGKSSPRLL